MKQENVSPYRWVILITTLPVIIATEMMWLSLSPISSVAESFYNVSSMSITLFTMSYMIMFVIFCIPASYVIDKFGYRASLIVGALLTGVFGLARGFAGDSFTVVLISQFFIAVGQPFLLNITTKVAANWFPFKERATAAGILTMAQYLGFALPMVMAPALAEAYDVAAALKIFGIIGAVAAAVSIIFSKEKPAIMPPGPIAVKEDFSFATLWGLTKNKPYMLALLICFISMGIFNMILTLIESILMPRGITPTEAGIIGAAFVLAGVIGAVILPIISDKKGSRRSFFVAAISALVPLYLGLTLVADFVMLTVIAALAGFMIMGVAPILFQHGSEVAYPIQEGTSLGTILLMGQISGTLFVFIFEIMAAQTGVVIPMLLVVVLNIIEVPMTLKLKESPLLGRSAGDGTEEFDILGTERQGAAVEFDAQKSGVESQSMGNENLWNNGQSSKSAEAAGQNRQSSESAKAVGQSRQSDREA